LFYGLITLFLLICLWECSRILRFSSAIYQILAFAVAGILFYNFSSNYFSQSFSFSFLGKIAWNHVAVAALFILALTLIFRFSDELETDSAKLIFTAVYVGVPFSLSLTIPFSQEPLSPEIFFIFILIWLSDSLAYLIGTQFGKHKLAPKISPNKSMEGLIGGITATLIAGFVIEKFLPDLRGNWVIIGGIIAIFAPLGDLAESKLKRIFGVKDSGAVIPGHGGFLDRLDSFIACVPFVFIYFLIDSLL
jgi:phosphatidate cytidylyltransferase